MENLNGASYITDLIELTISMLIMNAVLGVKLRRTQQLHKITFISIFISVRLIIFNYSQML